MKNKPNSEDEFRTFSDKLSSALGAFEKGKNAIDGESVLAILADSEQRLVECTQSDDALLKVTAEEQLKRVKKALRSKNKTEGKCPDHLKKTA